MTPDRRWVPFRRWHYDWLDAAAEFGNLRLSGAVLDVLESQRSFTAVVDGTPVFCGGLIEHWPTRHMGWGYFARGTLPHLAFITARTLELFADTKGRIEITVRVDFPPGHRWAKRLGFVVETPVLRAFGPEGENHTGYVRL